MPRHKYSEDHTATSKFLQTVLPGRLEAGTQNTTFIERDNFKDMASLEDMAIQNNGIMLGNGG